MLPHAPSDSECFSIFTPGIKSQRTSLRGARHDSQDLTSAWLSSPGGCVLHRTDSYGGQVEDLHVLRRPSHRRRISSSVGSSSHPAFELASEVMRTLSSRRRASSLDAERERRHREIEQLRYSLLASQSLRPYDGAVTVPSAAGGAQALRQDRHAEEREDCQEGSGFWWLWNVVVGAQEEDARRGGPVEERRAAPASGTPGGSSTTEGSQDGSWWPSALSSFSGMSDVSGLASCACLRSNAPDLNRLERLRLNVQFQAAELEQSAPFPRPS